MVDIIKPWAHIEDEFDGNEMLKRIERAGRTCYKSEDKITDESAPAFVKKIMSMGHESVLEHEKVTVRVVCDRGVTHEIVRHRLCAFSQESTRYCNYGKGGGQITVILPCFDWAKHDHDPLYREWLTAMTQCEYTYLRMLGAGASPQEARSVLPNSLKTEIVVTADLREWRHIFRLRTSKRAHPQMREIMLPLFAEFKERIPVVFDDIEVEG